jgi:hypothetical protein
VQFVIEIDRQAGRDLATEATEAYEALQFGVISHAFPRLAVRHQPRCNRAALATDGRRHLLWGAWIAAGLF